MSKRHTPLNKVEFLEDKFLVFEDTRSAQENRYVPYEIKESTFKNGLGIMGMAALSTLIPVPP